MDGETIDRHPGEHARPGSPPGWYPDPIRESSLRRWNGEHWTADVDPAAAIEEVQPSARRHAFNWPVLVAYVIAAAYWLLSAEWTWSENSEWAEVTVPGTGGLLAPPALVLLGLLGTRRQYSSGSRLAAVVLVCLGLPAILALLIAFSQA